MTSRAAAPLTPAAQKAANDSLSIVRPEHIAPHTDGSRHPLLIPPTRIAVDASEVSNDEYYDREEYERIVAREFLAKLLPRAKAHPSKDALGRGKIEIFLTRNIRLLAEPSFWDTLTRETRASIGFDAREKTAIDWSLISRPMSSDQARNFADEYWYGMIIVPMETSSFANLLRSKDRLVEQYRSLSDQELLEQFTSSTTTLAFLATLSVIVDRELPARVIDLPY